MCITEYAEARLEYHRTRPKPAKYRYSVSMEDGRELLNTRYDEVLRIMQWFIKTKRSRASVELVGGEEELIREAMYVLLRTTPKTEISLSTRVCRCVIWAQGKMIFGINRRFESKNERSENRYDIAFIEDGFKVVDDSDFCDAFWLQCRNALQHDRRYHILRTCRMNGRQQKRLAEEQNVSKQMISLMLKKAEHKLRASRSFFLKFAQLYFEDLFDGGNTP